MRPHAETVEISLFIKLFLLTVLVTVGACAKDETGTNTSVKTGVPVSTQPVTVREWYPTPKKSGQYTAFARPFNTPDSDIRSNQQYREHEFDSAWSAVPQEPAKVNRNIGQSASSAPKPVYSPWQIPEPGTAVSAETGGAASRRPWGAMDNTNRSPRRQQPPPDRQFQPYWNAGQGYGYGYGGPGGWVTPGW